MQITKLKKYLFAAIFLAVALLFITTLPFWQARPDDAARRFEFPVMSTWAAVILYGDPAECERAREVVQREFETVNRIANVFDPESELSRLNAAAPDAAAPFACSTELAELLALADRAWQQSQGAFDPSVKPLMELWGFHRKRDGVPSAGDIERTLEQVGWGRLVRFNAAEATVSFERPDVRLDMGGIAKGWAVDRAWRAVLAETAIRQGLINLGGNIRPLPEPPPGREAFSIGVTDPAHPDATAGEFPLLDGATASSGDYQRGIVVDGVRYSHILDPRTGYPSRQSGVTVVAPDAATADWLSTTLCVDTEAPVPADCAAIIFPGSGIPPRLRGARELPFRAWE